MIIYLTKICLIPVNITWTETTLNQNEIPVVEYRGYFFSVRSNFISSNEHQNQIFHEWP